MKNAVLAVCVLSSMTLAQNQRWAYTYNGPAGLWDQSWAITCGADTTVYVCGDAQRNALPLSFDMTAIRLTAGGGQSWVYSYNGPGGYVDQAYDLTVADDGSVFLAGSSWDLTNSNDFTVLGINSNGTHRWAYRIADSGISIARALVHDREGNVYAAGTTGDYQRFKAVSLTAAGSERWAYQYASLPGEAMAIARDSGGNVYAAGYLTTSDTTSNFEVVGVDSTGNQTLAIGVAGTSRDTAVAVTVGADGWVYAAGHVNNGPTGADIAVMGINPDTVAVSWTRYFDIGGSLDQARDIIYGPDGNIYICGLSFLPDSAGLSFFTLSLTRDGTLRWARTDTGGRGAAPNIAAGLTSDRDGNVYVCGMIAGTATTHMDAVVISYTPGGTERWRYVYASPDTSMDYFGSIAVGPDGNLYVAGTIGDPPNCDWVVVSLTTAGAIAENRSVSPGRAFAVPTVFTDGITIRTGRPTGEPLEILLCDAAGRPLVRRTLPVSASALTVTDEAINRLASGVYFLHVRSGAETGRFKVLKLRR